MPPPVPPSLTIPPDPREGRDGCLVSEINVGAAAGSVVEVGNRARLLTPSNPAADRFQIRLPGFVHDPKWSEAMEVAVSNAVQIVSGNCELFGQLFSKQDTSVTLLFKRAKRALVGQEINIESIRKQVALTFEKFERGEISARDLCDYVLAAAHHQYKLGTEEFMPQAMINGFFGAGTVQKDCAFGIPREIEPSFDTPFIHEGSINPYRVYADRAIAYRKSAACKDDQMMAKVSKLNYDSETNSYYYANPNAPEIGLNKTWASAWFSMEVEKLDQTWGHIDDLAKDVIVLKAKSKNPETLREGIGKIAEIHWWFAQSVPYCRGSAAIGDAFAKVNGDLLGIRIPGYKENIAPDLEAFVRPLPDFVKHYVTFFEGPMTWK